MHIIEEIRQYATEIGVEAMGCCKAVTDEHKQLTDIERRIKEFACNLEMDVTKGVVQPHDLLPNAKSFITILQSYTLKDAPMPLTNGYGKISCGAIFEDYHLIVRRKLNQLQAYIAEKYRANSLVFCDQSPFSDRTIAYLSGLGFIGNNSFLINKVHGSAVFIGYLLTDLELEAYDEPLAQDQCGGCTLCVNACPNQAISPNSQIDATRCISYLTQAKSIDSELKDTMNKALYGCDICQNVCPYNKETSNQSFPDLLPQYYDLKELLAIDNPTFKATFGKTAAGWRGKKYLQRNAILALSQEKTEESVAVLKPYLIDTRDDIRKEVIEALQKIGTPSAKEALERNTLWHTGIQED